MRKFGILVIVFLLPFWSFADVDDSLSKSASPKENFNIDIVSFEDNKVPVNYELFKCHINSKDFEVPMDYNNYVKSQIDFFGIRWQSKLKTMITMSEYIFPIYEEILSSYDMPMEIKYLSVIESALNPFAGSHAGAVGPWQFMPATARIFDLEINSSIDERRSLEKSTHAACSYLQQMYKQYGDWHMALAAYNCGPGNVRKAMRNSGKRDFWGIYNYLPRETQNYVPKFIAVTYMMNFYDHYGITPAPISSDIFNVEKVFCQKGLDFSVIAKNLEITVEDLAQINPEIKSNEIPYEDDGYFLIIPSHLYNQFYELQETIIRESELKAEQIRIEIANRPKPRYYYVKKGDCIQLIAQKFDISNAELRSWNNLRGNVIHPHQKLRVSN